VVKQDERDEAADRLRDDFRRFDYDCPRCGATLAEYAERCPYCGQNLFEVFSGTFRPRREAWVRVVAVVLLIAMLGTVVLAAVSLLLGRTGH
jgi:predicted amidophosphoribosyltransferase